MKKIEEYVRSIPDFPEPGIIFRDITSVLNDGKGLQLAIDSMDDLLKEVDFDVVVGTESRGFIFGVPIAYKEKKPFVPVRKKGKLPLETISQDYDLEYGSAAIDAQGFHQTGPGRLLSMTLCPYRRNRGGLYQDDRASGRRGCQGNLPDGAQSPERQRTPERLRCGFCHQLRRKLNFLYKIKNDTDG